jgi:glucokinase
MASVDVTLGIDIGGTNTKLGLVDAEGRCLQSNSIPTHANEPMSVFITHLMEAIDELHHEVVQEVNVKAVGIGAPNGNYYNGHIEKAPNLHWGDDIPLAAMIKEQLKLPVWLTNDANAAAIGEMKFGAAKGMKNFVVITLGTGLGSGIVMNGELVYGHDGFAGEVGHITVLPNGRDHTTKRRGSIETYVSATGMTRTIADLFASRIHPSEMRKIPYTELTSKMVMDEALKGDQIALEAFEYTGKLLGIGLADTVVLCNPEAIIIFGGLAGSGDLIMQPTKKYLEMYLPEYLKGKTKVLLSNLKGSNTAVLGASALAWEELSKIA